MAATANSPTQVLEKPSPPVAPTAANPQAGEVRAAGGGEAENAKWLPVLGLRCQLLVDLPIPGFTIADLLKLRPGSLVDAHWRVGRDVPLRLNGTLIGWIEFEVMGSLLAARLTELA